MEVWVRVKRRVNCACEFCWMPIKTWCWRSERGTHECDGCRKEAWRAEKERQKEAARRAAAIVSSLVEATGLSSR